MPNQKFDVFQDESRGLFRLQNPRNVKKERAANIRKTFHVSNDAERLAGETAEQQIVRRDCALVNFRNVPCRFMPKIGFVGCLAIRVDIRGKNAIHAHVFFMRQSVNCQSKPTNAAKQIHEIDRFLGDFAVAVVHAEPI